MIFNAFNMIQWLNPGKMKQMDVRYLIIGFTYFFLENSNECYFNPS